MSNFDLKKFRRVNGLNQKELAAYLGIKQPFVSRMENGDKPIPDYIIEKLRSNPDWSYTEATFRIEGDSIQQNGGTNNIGKVSGDAEVLALRREVDILREMVAELKKEKAEYWETIKSLTLKQ